MSIKDARQQFAKLVNSAGRGRVVAITRRGKAIAQIGPIRPAKRLRIPDLSAFRESLGKPGRSSATLIRRLRDRARY